MSALITVVNYSVMIQIPPNTVTSPFLPGVKGSAQELKYKGKSVFLISLPPVYSTPRWIMRYKGKSVFLLASPVYESLLNYKPPTTPTPILILGYVSTYEYIYDTDGSGVNEPLSVWKPVAPSGYGVLGKLPDPGGPVK